LFIDFLAPFPAFVLRITTTDIQMVPLFEACFFVKRLNGLREVLVHEDCSLTELVML
jgi:hypothetical protein